jgi:hypothetical protein
MHADFGGASTTRQIWSDGYVGLYGWLGTPCPGWIYELALIPAGVIAVLCVRELIGRAAALRARAGEVVVYCVICVGLMALIGGASYARFPAVDAKFGEVRYLLPLLGVVLALAARGAGRRWGPALGARSSCCSSLMMSSVSFRLWRVSLVGGREKHLGLG